MFIPNMYLAMGAVIIHCIGYSVGFTLGFRTGRKYEANKPKKKYCTCGVEIKDYQQKCFICYSKAFEPSNHKDYDGN